MKILLPTYDRMLVFKMLVMKGHQV